MRVGAKKRLPAVSNNTFIHSYRVIYTHHATFSMTTIRCLIIWFYTMEHSVLFFNQEWAVYKRQNSWKCVRSLYEHEEMFVCVCECWSHYRWYIINYHMHWLHLIGKRIALVQRSMVWQHNSTDYRYDGPVQPGDRIRIDETSLVEAKVTAVREFHVHGAWVVGCHTKS